MNMGAVVASKMGALTQMPPRSGELPGAGHQEVPLMTSEEATCECGCGEAVRPGRRFVHGHNKRSPLTIEQRFWEKVRKTDTCWNWTASKWSNGYGMFWGEDQKLTPAHRFGYELAHGPIPEGLVIDHLCRNTLCVNPDHLEAVTERENILRGTGASAKHARATHCIHGHEFTPENTYVYPSGRRKCRACKRALDRKLDASRHAGWSRGRA